MGFETVSVLWWEKELKVKYSINLREISRAKPKGFLKGSGFISMYISTQVLMQVFTIAKLERGGVKRNLIFLQNEPGMFSL